jgi:hypothetical protein
MSPNVGGEREGGCGVSADVQLCTWSPKINFGDLTPYLTYGPPAAYKKEEQRTFHMHKI